MAEGYEKVELKTPAWFLGLIAGGVIVTIVILLYLALQPTTTAAGRMTLMQVIALYLLTDAAVAYYFLSMRVVTSGSGIQFQRLFNSRSIPWDTVTSYAEVAQGRGIGKVIQLRNREGVITLSIPGLLGPPSERKRFIDMLDWHCKRIQRR
jgi:hypothetical protein